MNILELPEDCISLILSLTSPRDVLRSSAVSKQFLSVSESDTVWDTFLPSDCDDIISRSSSSIPPQLVSKKDLFLYLSDFPILLDNDTKSFWLDKKKGKICYMLGSRALTVEWVHPGYSGWYNIPESRFPECGVCKDVTTLDIKGRIDTTLLSPDSVYAIFFVFKMDCYRGGSGFGEMPMKASVLKRNEYGLPVLDDEDDIEIMTCYLDTPKLDKKGETEYPTALHTVRDDGWREVEMGMYHVADVGVNGEGERVVLEMSLTERVTHHWKDGLIFQGIELRPW